MIFTGGSPQDPSLRALCHPRGSEATEEAQGSALKDDSGDEALREGRPLPYVPIMSAAVIFVRRRRRKIASGEGVLAYAEFGVDKR